MGAKPQIRLVNITLLHFLTRIIFYVFVFFAGYITSRALSLHDFGQLQYISLWVNLSWIFLGLGVPATITRHFTQAFAAGNLPAIRKLVRYASGAGIITALLTLVLFVVLYRNKELSIPVLPVLVLAISQCLLSYLQVFIQGMYRYKTILALNVMAALTGSVFLIITIQSMGVLSYVYTICLVNLILCAGYGVTIIKAFQQLKPVSTDLLTSPSRRNLLQTSWFYGASAILAGILWQRFEISLLKEFFSYEKIAIYGIAFTVIALFAEPLKMLPSVLMYYFAGMEDKGSNASALFNRYFKHFSWLVIFCGVFMWFDAREIIRVLYTDKYMESADYLRVLLVGMIPGVCSYVLMNMHVGLGKARFLFVQDIIGAATFLGGLAIGNYYLGLYGIAWAKTIAIVIAVSMGLWYTTVRLRFDVPYYSFIASGVLSIVLLYPLSGLFNTSVVFLVAKALLTFGIYLVLSRKLKIIDRNLIDDAVKRLQETVSAFTGK